MACWPPRPCQVGTVQAVPKKGSNIIVDPQEFVVHREL